MLQIYFCDDDELYLPHVKKIVTDSLNRLGLEGQISLFPSLESLERDAKKQIHNPDLLFLDIEFQERNSIETAKTISRLFPSCGIVFLTNHISYATDVYETQHFYYVLKEELPDRIDQVLKRFFDGTHRILIRGTKNIWCYETRDVLFLERGRRCCYVGLKERNERIPISFETVAKGFPEPPFIRCHNSFLVNMSRIQRYEAEQMVLNDALTIPVSRPYREACRRQFLQWQEIWI